MISVIVPCYNEEQVLPIFYNEFCKLVRIMNYETFELILVDDGSEDDTLEIMRQLAQENACVRYISFSRNFGKEAAIYAGLVNSTGEYVAMMDVDLQDPPMLLPEMYRAVSQEGYDSAATRRVTRKGEPVIRSWFARKFYRIMNKISDADLADGARDYRLMSRAFVDAVIELNEYNRFSKGIFGWVGFKTKWIEFENVERVAGETKWSFWKLLLYAVDGIMAFSTMPLMVSMIIGCIISVFSFVMLIVIVVRKLIFGDPVAGWASTISITLFLSGVQMFCIGILGQYLAKAYLEVKGRPIYICAETNIADESSRKIRNQFLRKTKSGEKL